MSSTPIRILIADNHKVIREGLRLICEIKGGFTVVGEAENGEDAIDLSRRLKPDIILMDISMPKMDGVQATGVITMENPQVRVIVLTVHLEGQHIFKAIQAGAHSYLPKEVDTPKLLTTIEDVHSGNTQLDAAIAKKLMDEFERIRNLDIAEQLTEGEMEVLRLVAQGMENKAIAKELGLAESTIANRIQSIFDKLHVNNRTQAALFALRQGWASLDESSDEINAAI
ncbi:MAG: response regulator transcription factor [Chloroflexota bacterium]